MMRSFGIRWVLAFSLCCCWAAAQRELPIRPGDFLFVDVYRFPQLSTTAQVDATGAIEIPHVGKVAVSGMTEDQATLQVVQELRRILKRDPRVTVSRSVLGTSIREPARTPEMRTEVISLDNSNAEALWTALQGMSSEGGALGYDRQTNTLIVTDTASTIQNMQAVIARLDQMPTQRVQVRIEAKIAEVQVGALKELGLRWFVQGEKGMGGYYPSTRQDVDLTAMQGGTGALANEQVEGVQSSLQQSASGRRYVDEPNFTRRLNVPVHIPTPGQLFFGFFDGHVDIGTLLNALVADDRGEMLAEPWTFTVNHERAQIKMTDEFPYTEYGTELTGATNYSTKFMDLGIILDVTPHVYRDATGPYVELELAPEVSYALGTSNGIPVRSVRSSKTVAQVRDGQTLVIGGISQNDNRDIEQRVPVLAKVPLLGNLFKHTEKKRSQTELMVFVTPTIYERPEDITWDRMINVSSSAPIAPLLETIKESRKD